MRTASRTAYNGHGDTLSHGQTERLLRLAAVIDICRIEVGAARRKEGIRHLHGLRQVDGSARFFRQAHQAEAEFKIFHSFRFVISCSEAGR